MWASHGEGRHARPASSETRVWNWAGRGRLSDVSESIPSMRIRNARVSTDQTADGQPGASRVNQQGPKPISRTLCPGRSGSSAAISDTLRAADLHTKPRRPPEPTVNCGTQARVRLLLLLLLLLVVVAGGEQLDDLGHAGGGLVEPAAHLGEAVVDLVELCAHLGA